MMGARPRAAAIITNLSILKVFRIVEVGEEGAEVGGLSIDVKVSPRDAGLYIGEMSQKSQGQTSGLHTISLSPRNINNPNKTRILTLFLGSGIASRVMCLCLQKSHGLVAHLPQT